jgi:hypothetical protein
MGISYFGNDWGTMIEPPPKPPHQVARKGRETSDY